MLYMRSVQSVDDRTAAARIRDAALLRFGEVGFHRATVREIAAAAGVSPGLVLHHFGSKERLRAACDEYAVAQFARSRREAVESGATDPFAAMADLQEEKPLLQYFMQALREGSPASARLFDEIVRESEQLMTLSVREGVLRPSADLRAQAVLLVAWQFGGLLMQEHVARAFDAAPFSEEFTGRYARAALEVLTHGVFADTRYEDAWNGFPADADPESANDPTADAAQSAGPYRQKWSGEDGQND